eukprot:5499571-Pyramimonas_sp.AAC.1
MDLRPHRDRGCLSANYREQFIPTRQGVASCLPQHAKMVIPHCIDVLNYFRCPTVRGPGNATHWGLGDTFNALPTEIISLFTGRGMAVLPMEQRIETQDRPHANAWHAIKNEHDFVQLTLQLTHGATVRNQSPVP